MSRHTPWIAGIMLAVMLAGCGSQAALPLAPRPAATARAASTAKAPEALIEAYRGVKGTDAAALQERQRLIALLGDSDSDVAAEFLKAEYGALKAQPAASRKALEPALIAAMDAVNTYDPALDDPIIQAGPSSPDYVEALARKRRNSSFINWVTEPLRWAEDGVRMLWKLLTGTSKKKKKRKPGSGPAPTPAPLDPLPPAPPVM